MTENKNRRPGQRTRAATEEEFRSRDLNAKGTASEVSCPDCAGQLVANRWQHNDGCPLHVGLKRVAEADRAWFALRPDTTERHRPITPVELAEQRMGGDNRDAWLLPDRVKVTQVRPGVRLRHPYHSAKRMQEIAEQCGDVIALGGDGDA